MRSWCCAETEHPQVLRHMTRMLLHCFVSRIFNKINGFCVSSQHGFRTAIYVTNRLRIHSVRQRCGHDPHVKTHASFMPTHAGRPCSLVKLYPHSHDEYLKMKKYCQGLLLINPQCYLTVSGMRIADLNQM